MSAGDGKRKSYWRVGASHEAFGPEGTTTYYGTERGAKRKASRIARLGGFGWVPFVRELDLSGKGGGDFFHPLSGKGGGK